MVEMAQVVLLALSLMASVFLKKPVVCEETKDASSVTEVKCDAETCKDESEKVEEGLSTEG